MAIDPKAYAEPCGCGAQSGDPCPHTPIRCKHEFKWIAQAESGQITDGDVRKCGLCGFTQEAVQSWRVTSSGDPD